MVSERFAVDEMIVEELDRACLEQSLTIREVCAIYHKDQKTVFNLCREGRLVARQARFGAIWLISKRSCDERWDDNGKLRG